MEKNFEKQKDRVVAIHQPNYLPWPGFFYKIFASDIFVFHDNVEHSKRYPTRRTRIRKAIHSKEPCWLTVPLKKHSDFTLIKDLEIDHSQDWQGKHLRKIRNSYARTPFFGEFFPKLEEWLSATRQFDLLAEMNVYLVNNILERLGIERKILRSSDLPAEGKGSSYNVALVKYLGGRVYLSGKGGSNYQSIRDFVENGIELRIFDFSKLFIHWPEEKPYLTNSILESMFYISRNRLYGILETMKSGHAQSPASQ